MSKTKQPRGRSITDLAELAQLRARRSLAARTRADRKRAELEAGGQLRFDKPPLTAEEHRLAGERHLAHADELERLSPRTGGNLDGPLVPPALTRDSEVT